MHPIVIALLLLWLPLAGWAGNVALVIGNSSYRSVETLPNPVNDANAVADTLHAQGFEVTLANDLTRAEMLDTLRRFRDVADRADIAMVYYAGHGIEIGGRNYLVPVDARITDERDARLEMIELQDVLSQLSGARRMKAVFLDACRDNPFVTGMKRADKGRNVGRGLALVENAGADTLIAYAAAAGAITPDGAEGGNSPFTRAFLNAMDGPALDIRLLLGTVRDELRRSVPGAAPFVYSSLGGDSYLINPNNTPTPAPGAGAGARSSNAMLSDYANAELADNLAIWDGFLATYADQSDHTLYILARRNRDLKRATRDAAEATQPPLPRASTQAPAVSAPQPVEPTEPARPDLSRKEAIIEIQRLLKDRNCYPGRLDGIFGRQTAAGLATLSRQSDTELSMDRNSTTAYLAGLIDTLIVIDDATCPDVVVRKPAPKRQKQAAPVHAKPAPIPAPVPAPAPKAAKKKSETGHSVFKNAPNYCPQYGSAPGCRDGDRIDN